MKNFRLFGWKKLTGLFAIVLIASVFDCNAQEKKEILIKKADSIINSEIDADNIPGAVLIIKRGNEIVYKQAYGFAQKFDNNKVALPVPEKMTVDHLFDIASLTKVVGTTTSIMLLADRGLINVEDPVAKYIAAFGTPEKKGITIRHLLTHTAGLYEWYPLYYRAHNKEETFKLIGQLPLVFPTGAQRKYSDLGFTILGEIVEIVSGKSLDKFEDDNIFKPLGMLNTMYNPLKKAKEYKIAATSFGNPYEHRMIHDPALGFQFKEIDPARWDGWRHYVLKGEVNDGNAWYAEQGVSGAAGIFSNAEDLQKLVDMLKNNGKANGKQFISENTIKMFLTKDKFKNGLGWMMDPANSFMKDAPEGTFGHTGFTGTSITFVPSKQLSIILLINRQQVGLNSKMEYYNVNSIRAKIFKAAMEFAGE